jgi:hypothetical protein
VEVPYAPVAVQGRHRQGSSVLSYKFAK